MTAARTPSTDARPESATEALVAALTERVDGEVRFDKGARAAYSTDASNYRQVPIGVVLPRTIDAVVVTMAVCHEYDMPVLARGGGTSLAGECCNAAVVMDLSKYCHALVSLDTEARTAIVEPGAVLDDLNSALAEHKLCVGPKPSTHPTCTIGGMIGNNSCGSTAQAYGKMSDSVLRLEILTYDGERMWVGPTSDEEYARIISGGGRKAGIYRELRRIRDDYLSEIRTRYPKIPRRVSGYNLDSLLPENSFDVARALVGSESTLVTVLHAEIKLFPTYPHRSLVVLGYPDIVNAADAVPAVDAHEPVAVEGLDDRLIELEREEHLASDALDKLPPGSGWLMVQFHGDSEDEVKRRAEAMIEGLRGGDNEPTVAYLDDPAREDKLWKVREGGLGATAYPPHGPETHEGWEDAAVDPKRVGEYLREFRDLLDDFGYGSASLYGHFGHGCIHTRIPFDLTTADGIAAYRRFVERAARLVVSYHGSLSGEHGDGQARGELLGLMFGERIITAFGELKAVFDPGNRMNPGKVVHPYKLDENLRKGTEYRPAQPRTHFAFAETGNLFSQAAARCVGVGKCRGHEGGVMCPSYRATREEEHSTRGRARLLFEMLQGDVITDGWRSTEVRDALDLCLSCKGCKSDCPVNVDMATYKAEFLSHHYKNRPRPLSHYSMGWLPLWSKLAATAPRLVNSFAHLHALQPLLKRAGGIAPQREIPYFAEESFTSQFARGGVPTATGGTKGRVVLWPDTFNNNMHPHVANAAAAVLTDAGFDVTVPQRTVCCGLTWISTGQLATAKRVIARTLRALRDELREGTPIVVLEPSCAAVFRSDLTDLLPGDTDARRLSKQVYTLAELLRSKARDWHTRPAGVHAIAQVHCHQHAIMGFDPDTELMRRCGIDVEVLDSGCCGLAGNFGFERGHYDVSMAAAEHGLLPAVRKAAGQTTVLADGFSCRTQLAQSDTGARGVHLAEVLASALPGEIDDARYRRGG
ncbi:MAG: FAD-binding and (Fe-S)-binding domain-containing protein [Sciscionella sp.]